MALSFGILKFYSIPTTAASTAPFLPTELQTHRQPPSRQDRKRNLDLIAIACLEAKFGPGTLDVNLENVRAFRVNADGAEGDNLATDGDENA